AGSRAWPGVTHTSNRSPARTRLGAAAAGPSRNRRNRSIPEGSAADRWTSLATTTGVLRHRARLAIRPPASPGSPFVPTREPGPEAPRMGLFDRLKSIVGTAQRDLRGPLRLQPGDGVGYYGERFVVAGVRRLEAKEQVVWHYCLRDQSGASAVLAVEGPAAD